MSRSGAVSALRLLDRAALARASELRAGVAARAWPWGLPELEGLLPGGVPRGQVTEWAGPRSAGKTAALRGLVRAVQEAGAGVAYVDGTSTLTPAPWVFGRMGPNGAPPFWVVRPPEGGVLAAADELLRSAVFGLIVAEGGDWSRTPVIRLQRLAREAGAALIAVVDRPGRVPLAGLRVRFSPDLESRTCRVEIPGRGLTREVAYVHDLPYRLPEDSGLPDRRPSARSTR